MILKDVEGFFLSKAGLTVHRKRIYEISSDKVKFNCDNCSITFELKSALVNHIRGCGGMKASSDDLRKCNHCLTEVTKSNLACHKRACRNWEGEDQNRPVIPRGNRKECDICGVQQ